MDAVITLTTDFGLNDAYVAAMKGVILDINPRAKLVDICHTIPPQNIHEGAFILGTAWPYFPKGSIHLVVVDPGVGSKRKPVILRTPAADFVAPDNGVLSYVIQSFQKPAPRSVKLAPELQAVALTKPDFWRSPVSPTFHGRDIFAPVAAWLSLGKPPADFGEKLSTLTVLPLSQPQRREDGELVGQIIHIDSFGNLVTNIRDTDLPGDRARLVIDVANRRIAGLKQTYDDGEGLLALLGSTGYVEVSLKGGSAQAMLKAHIGGEVTLKT